MTDPIDEDGPYQQKWTKSSVTNPNTKVSVDVYRKEEGQYRSQAWDTDINVSGSIGWADTQSGEQEYLCHIQAEIANSEHLLFTATKVKCQKKI